jgi:hypothetical protein
MASVLVLYYSSYGHVEIMAEAVADGVRAAGATADVKRVAETTPVEVAKEARFKLEQHAPIAPIEDLSRYDAIIVGAPTRFRSGACAPRWRTFSTKRVDYECGARSLEKWAVHSPARPRSMAGRKSLYFLSLPICCILYALQPPGADDNG